MRDRLVIPVLLPLLTLGAILLAIFSFGHLLLQVEENYEHWAWPLAIIAAAAVLGIAALIASRPKTGGWLVPVATALPVSVLLGAGLYYLVRPGPEAAETGPKAATVIAAPGPIAEVATDNKFANTAYSIVAGKQYTLNLTNNGTSTHNWHLKAPGADGKEPQTALLPGGQSESANFTVAQPGTYNFLCDVHPTEMTGQVTVLSEADAATASSAAGGAGGGASGPGNIAQTATDNKFSATTLTANANEATTVNFQNKGSAIHNFHVLGVKGADGKEPQTQLLPGGQSETLTFTIATAGTYDFQCDVHAAEMKGKLTVK